jgi:hypothetical protein
VVIEGRHGHVGGLENRQRSGPSDRFPWVCGGDAVANNAGAAAQLVYARKAGLLDAARSSLRGPGHCRSA